MNPKVRNGSFVFVSLCLSIDTSISVGDNNLPELCNFRSCNAGVVY